MVILFSMKNTKSKLSKSENFGDSRLKTRFKKLCSDLTIDIKSPITTASKNQPSIKGAYRFFSNEKVSQDKIIQAHLQTLNLGSQKQGALQRILQISDTTELDYTRKKSSGNLGVLNYPKRKGFYLHNDLLVSNLGVPIGVFKQTYLRRELEYLGKSEERRKLPLNEKESYRWYEHFKAGEEMCQKMPDTEWVYIADREADFMEMLVARTCPRMHYVIRAQYNRNLQKEALKLFDKLTEQPLGYTYEAKVLHAKTKKKRIATLEVRSCSVTLELCKKHPSGYVIPPTKINAIEVREINPPQDIEQPIYWVLLTTLDIDTNEQLEQIIGYYIWRWLIERFFYLLKTGGANVEQLQLKTQHRLENAISTYSIAIMNVMKMRYLAENQPETPINELGITKEEHEALYTVMEQRYPKKIQYNADHIPTIKEYCIVLGMLGGFYPSKRQPLPGLKILTRSFDMYHLIYDVFIITRMSKN